MDMDANTRKVRLEILFLAFLMLGSLTGCNSSGDTPQNSPQSLVLGDSDTQDDDPPLPDPLADYHDCRNVLPCEWLSNDGAIEAVFDAAYIDQRTGYLTIVLSIEATRDSEVEWLSAFRALSGSGLQLSAESETHYIGNVLANTDQATQLLAGLPLSTVQTFRPKLDVATQFVARYSYGFVESGVLHEIQLLNLPINQNNHAEVSCDFILPCSWKASNNQFSVTVLLVDGLSVNGTLKVHYSVVANEDLLIAAGSGWEAVSTDGTVFNPKIHTLGVQSDFKSFEVSMIAESRLLGSQSYFKNASSGVVSMAKIPLDLSSDGITESKIPVFRDLPIQ